MTTTELLPADRRRAAALVKHVLAKDEQGIWAILRETVEAERTGELILALAGASALITIGNLGSRELATTAWARVAILEFAAEAALSPKENC